LALFRPNLCLSGGEGDEEEAEAMDEEEAEAAREAGHAALAKAAKKKGAVQTASGLIYHELKAGKGKKKPSRKDTVKVSFSARLIDGTVFDQGTAAAWKTGSVVRGLSEGLQLMTPGAKARLTIPADLAYGDTREGEVPAHSTLVFELELIAIV